MDKEYSTFFRLLRGVVHYSCDILRNEPESDGDEFDPDADGEANRPARPLSASVLNFFQEFYEPREEAETFLIKALRKRNSLLCLIGSQGAGKTTLGYHVREQIAKQWPSTFIVFLDLKYETATRAIDISSPQSLEDTLRQRLITEYLQRLFPYGRVMMEHRVALWAYLLDAEVKKPLNLLSTFAPLQDHATHLLRIHDARHREDPPISVHGWLTVADQAGDVEVSNLTKEVDAKLEFAHLSHAAWRLRDVTRQLIWLDNIDSLPDAVQADAVDAVKRIYHPVSDLLAMLVAVREENIFRDHDIDDAPAPPHDTRIRLDMPRTTDGAAFFPAHDIPIASEKFLHGMMAKRLQAARSYQEKRVAELRELKAKLESVGDLSDADTERLADVDADLADLQPVISPSRFQHVLHAADRLQTAMSHERAIYIANNSLRNYLFIVRDTLADVFREDEVNGIPPGVNYSDWHLATLFLRRVRNAPRRYQVGMYDVIRQSDDYAQVSSGGVSCLLPYLVLTTIWNLTLRSQTTQNRYGYTPRVADIVKTLERLGYTADQVLRAMHEQYLRNNTRQNLIDFRTRTMLRTPSEIDKDMVAYMTLRGKCLVTRTGSSFGYLYDCLRGIEYADQPDMLARKLTTLDVDDVINRLLPYLCDMAEVHCQSLRHIRDAAILGERGWLERYYVEFGTPQLPPYARSSAGGRMIKGVRRTLLVEGILGGLITFLRKESSARDRVHILANAVADVVNELEAGRDPADPKFRLALGLPPRAITARSTLSARLAGDA